MGPRPSIACRCFPPPYVMGRGGACVVGQKTQQRMGGGLRCGSEGATMDGAMAEGDDKSQRFDEMGVS